MFSESMAPPLGLMPRQSDVVSPWYALKVHAGSEPLAATGLRARGYEPFFPAYEEHRKYSDRIKTVLKAAFPGYLFCRLNLRAKATFLDVPAVSYVVSCAGAPLAVPEAEIEGVRRVLELGGVPAPCPKEGQRIRISYGALSGVEGILTRIDGKDRLTVSVQLLQRSVAVQVTREQIVLL
jgi:transcription antitermination factor NusG